MQKRTLVILTIDIDNLPENFPEIIQTEREVVAAWKKAGYLDLLFLRQTINGSILIFNDLETEKVMELMKTLPLYPLKKSIEVFPILKDEEI